MLLCDIIVYATFHKNVEKLKVVECLWLAALLRLFSLYFSLKIRKMEMYTAFSSSIKLWRYTAQIDILVHIHLSGSYIQSEFTFNRMLPHQTRCTSQNSFLVLGKQSGVRSK